MKHAGGQMPVPKFADPGVPPFSTTLTIPGGGSLSSLPMTAGGGCCTVSVAVAVLESALPSLALKVNESLPEYVPDGVYVTEPPLTEPTPPWAG